MSWVPNAQVTIGGVSYTSKVVDSIQITYGRQNIWEQARTGYATINLIQLANTFIDFEINSTVTVSVQNSSGVQQTVFTGTLNNVQYKRAGQGLTDGTTAITITAVGPFAKMSRVNVGGSNYPKEFDDARMSRILTESGVTIDVVDTPPVYELAARTGNLTDSYTLAANTASEVFGYIYETTTGKVGYANQSHRLNDLQANGFVAIPSSYIFWNTLSTTRNLNNLLNDLSLDYNAGTVTSTSAGSIAVYGPASGKITTSLHNVTDAQNLADFYIATRSAPQTNVSSFSVYLHTSQLSATTRNKLINTYLGMPIEIPDLPASMFDGVYHAFVEGWTLTIDRMRGRLDLISTDSTLSVVPTRWQDVDPLQKWNMVGSTIRWFEYE